MMNFYYNSCEIGKKHNEFGLFISMCDIFTTFLA